MWGRDSEAAMGSASSLTRSRSAINDSRPLCLVRNIRGCWCVSVVRRHFRIQRVFFFVRAVLLGAIAIVSAASQKCVDLVGPGREQVRTSCMLAIADSQ